MEVQSLTADQQKNSLSGKKQTKKKISARNTLSTPYSPYWPTVSPENEAELEYTLNSMLSPAKLSYNSIPWSQLRKLSKEQRREKLQCSSGDNKIAKNLRKALVLGVNAVSRALEARALSCALVAGDVQPRILVSHLAALSEVQDLPLLVLSSLRSVCRAQLGFPSIALGVKKSIGDCEEAQFQPLVQLVSQLWCDVPRPDSLSGFLTPHAVDISPEDSSASEEDTDTIPRTIDSLHLRRSSRKQRAFAPDGHQPSALRTEHPVFISLQGGDTPPASSHQCPEPKTKFHPLKVKRIQPNPKKIRKRKKGNKAT